MKRFISLMVLLLSITLFISHGTSFSNAEIRNSALLTIVPEEHALIAITYGENNDFYVTNNTAKIITTSKIEIVNEIDNTIISLIKKDSTVINPGNSNQFTLPEVPSLAGKVIQLTAHWKGGSAKIKSTIPKSLQKMTSEEITEEDIDSEPDEENATIINPNINDEDLENEDKTDEYEHDEDTSESDTEE